MILNDFLGWMDIAHNIVAKITTMITGVGGLIWDFSQ